MKPVIPIAILGMALLGAMPSLAQGPIEIRYVHTLSNFSGPIGTNYVALFADRAHDETFTSEGDRVRVFNANGMEIYQFVHEITRGPIQDLVVDSTGDFLLLTCASDGPRPCALERTDFRGEFIESYDIVGLPPEVAEFHPTMLDILDDRVYVLDRGRMFLAVTDTRGRVQTTYDLAAVLRLPGIEKANGSSSPEILGFDVAPNGEMLFTVPVWFKAFVVAPDGSARAFGRAGSNPGLFGVISGIGVDSAGHILVTDRLHGVVHVFSGEFQYLGEFGRSVGQPDSLVRPGDVEFGNGGRVFVTQLGNRGVAAFNVVSR